MKIAIYETEDWEIEYFRKYLSGHTLEFHTESLDENNTESLKDVDILSVFIYSEATAKALANMPNLKLIVTRSMGFDHIDLAYCKRKGITVCNVPTYGANTVAEHTFALLLALSRKVVTSVERTRRGNFEVKGLRGIDLNGKTIGVIGVGTIGKEVIRIAKGFGMHIVAYTRNPDEELAKKLRITFHSLPELLKLSDVITLHVPLSKQTEHMLNKRNILKCKPGSILINTARGGLIETEAILIALEKGIFRGVGLDVLEEECGVKEEMELLTGKFFEKCDLKTQLFNHVLLSKENVIITPHNAFNSDEALETILQVTVENIDNFLQGTPENIVKA